MTFKPAIWVPIAWVLAVVNLGAIWFAAEAAEPLHAGTHAALAVVFALWAERMRRRPAPDQDPSFGELRQQLDEMQVESDRQIAELNERLDFAERLLAQDRMTQGIRPPESET